MNADPYFKHNTKTKRIFKIHIHENRQLIKTKKTPNPQEVFVAWNTKIFDSICSPFFQESEHSGSLHIHSQQQSHGSYLHKSEN